MKLLTALSVLAAEAGTIPARPATTEESLRLMGIGWGSIFIVIAILIVLVLILNAACRNRQTK